jgi:hypothetical protein
VKRTFAAASSSAASEREIQSAGGFDIGQSGSFETDSAAGAAAGAMEPPSPEDDPDEEDSAEDDPDEEDSVEDDAEEATVSVGSGRLDLEEVAFSLRAQPVPLK